MIQIPLKKDPEVNHVTCNVVDFPTKEFHGKGFDEDQYWDEKTIDMKTKGSFTGMIKTDILGKDRFYEKITGFEDVLWTKIRSRSKGYYIHKGLYIWHTEGEDRICKQKVKFKLQDKANQYKEISNDNLYWAIIEKNAQHKFIKQCFTGLLFLLASGDKNNANIYYKRISRSNLKLHFKILAKLFIAGGPFFAKSLIQIKKAFRLKKRLYE